MGNTLLIIFSDHGEAIMGDNFSHGDELYEELIRVPLFIYYPERLPKGKIIDTQVSIVDIMPTVLDIVGLPINPNKNYVPIQGKSLLPIILGDNQQAGSTAYSEVWKINSDIRVVDQAVFASRREGKFVKPKNEDLLYQRCVRFPEFKFIMQGEDWDELENLFDNADLSDEEFLENIYKRIFLTFKNKGATSLILQRPKIFRVDISKMFRSVRQQFKRSIIETILRLITRFRITNKFRWKQIAKICWTIANKLRIIKCMIIDLKRYSRKRSSFDLKSPQVSELKAMIKKISKGAVTERKIAFETDEEKDKIIKHLKEWGYF